MPQYLILQDPGHNKVYYTQATKLCLAELNIASKRFESICSNVESIIIYDVPYITFTLEQTINDNELSIVSRLSFAFVLFEYVKTDNKEAFIPIGKSQYQYLDQKISSLLKYPGKTNELFTKMMINVALLSSDFSYEDHIQLLDPIAGRGTTLFEGAVYGFDCFGIELEAKSTKESYHFFKRFLEQERYKHRSAERSFKNPGDDTKSTVYEFEYSKDKGLFKDEKLRKNFSLFNANSAESGRFFKKETIQLIVGDLPYGIAHGNTGKQKQGSITRSPEELLALCLPAWNRILMKGGSIVLAWNKFVLPKNRMIAIFEENQFDILTEQPYSDFEHRVDNAIKRDIIVAKKK